MADVGVLLAILAGVGVLGAAVAHEVYLARQRRRLARRAARARPVRDGGPARSPRSPRAAAAAAASEPAASSSSYADDVASSLTWPGPQKPC